MFDKIKQFFFGKSDSDIYWENFFEWFKEQPLGTCIHIGTIVRTPQKAMELAEQQATEQRDVMAAGNCGSEL